MHPIKWSLNWLFIVRTFQIRIPQNITREISNIEERNFFGNNNPNPPCTQENGINREDDKQRDCPRIIERQSSGAEWRDTPSSTLFRSNISCVFRAIPNTCISRWFTASFYVSPCTQSRKRGGKGRRISVGSRVILSESRGLWIFGEDRWRWRTTCLSFLVVFFLFVG